MCVPVLFARFDMRLSAFIRFDPADNAQQSRRRKDDSEYLPPLLSQFPSILTNVEDLLLSTLPFGSPIVPARSGVGAGAGTTGVLGTVPGLDDVNVIAGAFIQRGTQAAGPAFALAPAPVQQSNLTTSSSLQIHVNVLVEEEISCVQLGGTSERSKTKSSGTAALHPGPPTSMPAAATVEVHGQIMCAKAASSATTSLECMQKSDASVISLELTGMHGIVGESICRGARMLEEEEGRSSSVNVADVLLLGRDKGFQRVFRYRALPPQSDVFGAERPLSFLPVTASYAARSSFCTGTPEYVDIELRLLIKLNFSLEEGARVEQFCAYLPLSLPSPPCTAGTEARGGVEREYMATSQALEASCGVFRLTPDGRGVRWWPVHSHGEVNELAAKFLIERGGCLQGTVRFQLQPSSTVYHARAMQRERARRDAFARQMQQDAEEMRRVGLAEAEEAGGGAMSQGKQRDLVGAHLETEGGGDSGNSSTRNISAGAGSGSGSQNYRGIYTSATSPTRRGTMSSTSARTLELSDITQLCVGTSSPLIFPAHRRDSDSHFSTEEQKVKMSLLSAIGAGRLTSSTAQARAAKEAFDRDIARAVGVGSSFSAAGMAGPAGNALSSGLASRATWLRAFAALTYSIEGASISGLRAKAVSRQEQGGPEGEANDTCRARERERKSERARHSNNATHVCLPVSAKAVLSRTRYRIKSRRHFVWGAGCGDETSRLNSSQMQQHLASVFGP